MTRYLSMITYTDRGLQEVKGSIARAKEFRSLVETAGGQVDAIYWAVGETDGAVIFQVPDEQAGAAVLMKLADQGFVRTKTLRIYDESEFEAILANV